MRTLYPDWKYNIEAYLHMQIPFEWNELLWWMYDERYSVEDALEHIVKIHFPDWHVVRTGYRGTIRGIIDKRRMGLIIP